MVLHADEQRKACWSELFRRPSAAVTELTCFAAPATRSFNTFTYEKTFLRPDEWRRLGSNLAFEGPMRRRLSRTILIIVAIAIVPAALTLRVALAAGPIALREPGSLLLLGLMFLILSSIARRAFVS